MDTRRVQTVECCETASSFIIATAVVNVLIALPVHESRSPRDYTRLRYDTRL